MKRLILRRSGDVSPLSRHGVVPAVLAFLIGGPFSLPALAAAQHAHADAGQSADSAHHGSRALPTVRTVSARAGEQIGAVERAVAVLAKPDSALAAGFAPFLGMLPTMGVHEVNTPRLLDAVSLLEPDVLMFSPVDGEQRLVGVAYGFLGQAAEAPDLFDGTQDVWHDHPEFAPPGQSLVMLHVWFVPSPDGPFAGHNPWLAYWGVGIEPPSDSVMSEPASAARARRLALALAEAAEPLPVALADMGMAGLEMAPGVAARRDSLRAIIPRLKQARHAPDPAAWDREADAAIAIWERIRDAYLDAIPTADDRERLAVFYRQMETGVHAH